MKLCSSCGGGFHPRDGRQKRCGQCRSRKAGAPRPGVSFGLRRCPTCGAEFEARQWNQAFCRPQHARWAQRSMRNARYGSREYRLCRRALEPVVAQGRTQCVRCGELILPGEPWDLGHVDGGTPRDIAGPEHVRCNRAVQRHAKERRVAAQSQNWDSQSWMSRDWFA